jgi:lysyl-tRNA synthetase, class II
LSQSAEGRGRIFEARLAKLERLRAMGVEPYAYSYAPTHRAGEASRALPEGSDEGGTVRVAGRLQALRTMGKSVFAHLVDESGRLQLYFRRDVIGEEAFELIRLLDIGDWIGVEGPLFRTRAGEVTVRAEETVLLAKSLLPPPFGKEEQGPEGEKRVYSGFADRESRYRRRYLDLAVNPKVREVFRVRARLIRELRSFLDERGFVEVETPVLQPIYGGALARPFVTHHNTLDMKLYLRIAVELYLKRLIVGGFERVYELGKNFRNEGMSRFHNPEFTMLEFYAAYMDYVQLMELTEEMLGSVVPAVTGGAEVSFGGQAIDFTPPYRRLTLYEALATLGQVEVRGTATEELRNHAHRAGVQDAGSMERWQLVDELFSELVEPQLVQPTFITDYPREMSPLAKPKRGEPELTERFELYAAGKELLNAYGELNDPLDQRRRFEAQMAMRAAGNQEAQLLDEDFLRALEYGMPPTGGFGMGIDRLMMVLTDQTSIRDVILFPTLRPGEGGE